MEISAGIKSSLAGRYASALFDLAVERGQVSAVEGDLERLGTALHESDALRSLTTNPRVSRGQADAALAGVGDALGISPLTRDFLRVLAANRRLPHLAGIVRAFGIIAAGQRGEVAAHVTSAHPLSDDQMEALRRRLTAREGRTVKLTASVDPDLLGGLVVTVGSRRIDGSIRTRLNTLAQAMAAA